jgi:hypothetical protein
MGEEARSLRRGLAGHLPGRLDIERRMPGEGEEVEGGERVIAGSAACGIEAPILRTRIR